MAERLAVFNQGIDHVDLFGGLMETPEERQGQDAAELDDKEAAETVPESGETPPKPVDDPNLPEDGDPEDFDEEPVADEEFDQYADNNDTMDNQEEPEEPNDLSEIDKEFEDED